MRAGIHERTGPAIAAAQDRSRRSRARRRHGKPDRKSVAICDKAKASKEIKEWQAIMDYLRTLPAKKGELPVIPVDARAAEVRAIKAD